MPTPQFEIQNVLKRAKNLDVSTQFQPYSCVEIITGAETEDWDGIYRAPSDQDEFENAKANGRLLTINNEWGTQAQANNILAYIRGFAYQPYVASGALVDPNAELGDGVSVNDVYSGIYKMTRNFSSLMAADIEAPQSEEIDHEYPFEPNAARKTTRKFSSMESELRMNSQEISAKVSVEGGESQSVSWSLKSDAWRVYANGKEIFKVTSTGAEVSGKVTATSGKIGGFDIGSSAISYNGLTWNGTKNGIYLGTSGIQLGSKNGSFFQASASGDVKANNMTLTGTLNVGGSTISAANLRSGAVGGNNWAGAKTGYGYATDVWANSFHSQSTSYFAYVQTYVITHYGTKREYRPITITVDGTSYSVWGARL